MLKRLVMWTGCLSYGVFVAAGVCAEDSKPPVAGAASPVQPENQKDLTEDKDAVPADGAVPAENDPAESKAPGESNGAVAAPAVASKPAPEMRKIGTLSWHTDYSAAYRQAREEHRQLLLFFRDEKDLLTAGQLEQNALAIPELREPLSRFVRVVLSNGTTVPLANDAKPDAKPVRLLDHPCFVYMQRQGGLAIVDLVNEKDALFGKCVSAHPFSSRTLGQVGAIKIILELPRGTITQRTLTFVLRTHPERPASVWGQPNPFLYEQARYASQLMVNYGSVGHHDWGSRSSYIMGQFGSGASEVASMGSGSNLFEAAQSAVNLWRGSSTHWGMMITPNRYFGYDMVQHPNGTWFANGLFVQ